MRLRPTRIRSAIPALALTLLVVALAPQRLASAATANEPTAAIRAVGPIGMTVGDLERSLDFYQRVLGFEKIEEVELGGETWQRLSGLASPRLRVVTLRLGDERLMLTEYLTPRGRPIAPDARANDRDFQHVAIIVRDMPRAYAWLRENGVRHASKEPQRLPDWNSNAAGIEAFYFRDPDGHFLEILAFPPDKGAAKWHEPGEDLFLGIDHTAIVVADTAASLELYRDVLGMRVAGESVNSGIEQERLNGVPGAHLRITTLRADVGPGIELLEYLAPRDGRLAARDTDANDVVHWETRIVVADVARTARALRGPLVAFVSSGPVAVDGAALGFTSAFVVRDPDGHALQVADDTSSATEKESTP